MLKKKFYILMGAALMGMASVPMAKADNIAPFIRTASGNTPAFQTDFTVAAEKTVNSVVCIQSYETPRSGGYGSPFDFFEFFGFQIPQQRQQPRRDDHRQEPVQTGTGSGVIVSSDGYIVTNHHVVAGAEKLEVLLNDNTTYTARVIGTDEATDLALIKIDAKKLQPIEFGNSDDVKIGEWVLAVGNPFGLNSTVTAGIISARSRALDGGRQRGKMGIESYLQTDAAINPGNSGGALVNLNGELIGINAAIYSRTGSYTGYAFAIPTSIVSKVITDLRTFGAVQRGVLGISVRQLDSALAKELKITATHSGVVVMDVEQGSTGDDLGLKENDVIVGINNTKITSFPELQEKLSTLRPGDKITVQFYRNNKLKSATATLKDSRGKVTVTPKIDYTSLGAAYAPLTDKQKEEYDLNYGLSVVTIDKNSPMAKAGIKKGFVIVSVNDIPMHSLDDMEQAYDYIKKDDSQEPVLWIVGYNTETKKTFYCAVPISIER